jgi:hypothetical protein
MADTIIERETTKETGDSSAGWAVAVIILLLVVAFGAYYIYHHRSVAPAAGGTNINVTIPAPSGGTNSGSTGQ